MTHEDAYLLASKSTIASEEVLIEENCLNQHNLQEILRKVMQEDGFYWDAIRFLEVMKEKNPNMLYCIKYSKEGKPEAILWMLPEMREDLVCFGDIMFLDAQERDYNQSGWPYIGPCIKDNENHVRVVCECICIVESHDMYCWILQSLGYLEERWSLKNLRILFADQLIKESIVSDLQISDKCFLHGDPYHFKNKVFPEVFGDLYKSVCPYLDEMINADTKEVWDSTYAAATSVTVPHPRRQSELQKIYDNPRYYSQWYLNKIEGNFGCKGSTHAEQNHSSITAHLGQGGNFSIVEHIKVLIERQVRLGKQRRELELKNNQTRKRFKSAKAGHRGLIETEAKKVLSTYAFEKLFKAEARKNLQKVDNGIMYTVWSCAYDWECRHECGDYVEISLNERCKCFKRKKWSIQCRHELCIDEEFDISKYHPRWMNDLTYQANVGVPLTIASKEKVISEKILERELVSSCDILQAHSGLSTCHSGGLSTCHSTDSLVGEAHESQNDISYQSVLAECETLLRLISLDKSKLSDFSDNVKLSLKRARSNMSIKVSFDTALVDYRHETQDLDDGRLGYWPNASNMKRMKSKYEKRTNFMQKKRKSSNGVDYCQYNIKTKSCGLCHAKGHTRNHCPKVSLWNGVLIHRKEDRSCFGNSLTNSRTYDVKVWLGSMIHHVATELPTSMKGIVVHGLYIFGHTTFVSCTLLMSNLDAHTLYAQYPFSITLIRDYVITCAKTHVVINQMKKTNDAEISANTDGQSEFASAFGTASYSQSSNGCV